METAEGLAKETGGQLLLTDDVGQGVSGVDFLCTDVWVSMGEAKSVWRERIGLLSPYQVNTRMIERAGNPAVRFMHCLPAFYDRHTKVGEEIYGEFGLDGLEVTDEVFESHAQWYSTRPRTGSTRSRRFWSPRSGTERVPACSSIRPEEAPVRIVIALGG